jgi:hypothetical protein
VHVLMTTTFGGDAGGGLCAGKLPQRSTEALMSSSTGRYLPVVFVIELFLYTWCKGEVVPVT